MENEEAINKAFNTDKEPTLSDKEKEYTDPATLLTFRYYPTRDVKEFIKELHKKCRFREWVIISKLAGEKLI